MAVVSLLKYSISNALKRSHRIKIFSFYKSIRMTNQYACYFDISTILTESMVAVFFEKPMPIQHSRRESALNGEA